MSLRGSSVRDRSARGASIPRPPRRRGRGPGELASPRWRWAASRAAADRRSSRRTWTKLGKGSFGCVFKGQPGCSAHIQGLRTDSTHLGEYLGLEGREHFSFTADTGS